MQSLRAPSVAAAVALSLSVLGTTMAAAKRAPAPPATSSAVSSAASAVPPIATSAAPAPAAVPPAPAASVVSEPTPVAAPASSAATSASLGTAPATTPDAGADDPDAGPPATSKQPPPRSYGTPGEGADIPVSATRRRGFLVGFVGALSVGSAEGTPPAFDKRNDTYHVNTSTTAGSNGTLFLGGAITDWFSFSVGLGQTKFSKRSLTFSSTSLLFRAEAYPLFGLGGHFRDLGVGVDLGTGSSRIDRGDEAQAAAGGGSTSVFGGGLFYELLRGHGFALSPYVGVQHLVSETLTTNTGLFGLRASFTTGP
jgi:hypothetical protein